MSCSSRRRRPSRSSLFGSVRITQPAHNNEEASETTGLDIQQYNNNNNKSWYSSTNFSPGLARLTRLFHKRQLLALEVEQLELENARLRLALQRAEAEKDRIQNDLASRIVLESFEGSSATVPDGQWCDELENGACPVEPTVSFGEALRDRAYWLVGLLLLQSVSGVILSKNEVLLAEHPVIVYFLTCLVGAGGNAGNQASVRVIRGLALGTLNDRTRNQFLLRELKMAAALSGILAVAGFLRAMAFRTPLLESMAVTCALLLIVFCSICLGAVLPLILKGFGVDPAHSSTTIQVLMDILGVLLAVAVSSLLLDSPFGAMLILFSSRASIP